MNETQPNQADSEQVIVALEGDAGNLDKLVTVARECGFRKLLSALVKDLQKAQAETIEIIAMAAADELREPDCQRLKRTNWEVGGGWPSAKRRSPHVSRNR